MLNLEWIYVCQSDKSTHDESILFRCLSASGLYTHSYFNLNAQTPTGTTRATITRRNGVLVIFVFSSFLLAKTKKYGIDSVRSAHASKFAEWVFKILKSSTDFKHRWVKQPKDRVTPRMLICRFRQYCRKTSRKKYGKSTWTMITSQMWRIYRIGFPKDYSRTKLEIFGVYRFDI